MKAFKQGIGGVFKGKSKVEAKLLGIELELSPKHSPVICNIVHTSAVALSGAIAVGEQLVAVDAQQVEELDAKTLQELLDGDPGSPVWLDVRVDQGSPTRTVPLLRQLPLEAPAETKPAKSMSMFGGSKSASDSSSGAGPASVGLKIKFQERGWLITHVVPGGAAWLGGWVRTEQRRRRLEPGAFLIRVDGKTLAGLTPAEVASLLTRDAFQWVALELAPSPSASASSLDDVPASAFRLDLLPSPPISERYHEAARHYDSELECLPTLPPLARTGLQTAAAVSAGTPLVLSASVREAAEAAIDDQGSDTNFRAFLSRVELSEEMRWTAVALVATLLAQRVKGEQRLLAAHARKSEGGAPAPKGDETLEASPAAESEGGASWRSALEEEEVKELPLWYSGLITELTTALGLKEETSVAFLNLMSQPDNDPAPLAGFLLERPAGETTPGGGGGAAKQEAAGGAGEAAGEDGVVWEDAVEAGAGEAGGGAGGEAGGEDGEGRGAGGTGWVVCWVVLMVQMKGRRYDARGRGLLRRLAEALGVPWAWIKDSEVAVSEVLVQRAIEEKVNELQKEGAGAGDAGEDAGGKSTTQKRWRAAKIGGAALLGGALIGITGGLAAPAVIAGLGVVGGVIGVGGTLAASAAAFGGLSAVLGVTFGAAGAGLVGYKYNRRLQDIKEFAFDMIDNSPGLTVTIGVPGWLDGDTDSAWKVWDQALCQVGASGGEALALRWESGVLRDMGKLLTTYVKQQAVSTGTTVVGNAVIGAAFITLMWPRALLSAADWIDTAWSVAQLRADMAGVELANALAARAQGHRPVTLIGFGMGARVVLKCLQELADRGEEGFGLVETAVCMGTPWTAAAEDWEQAAEVCGHRLVNVYCQSDKILAFVFRSASFARFVAGLQAIESEHPSLQNLDVTGIVNGHWEYRDKLYTLLQLLGIASGKVIQPAVPAVVPPAEDAGTAEVVGESGEHELPLMMDDSLHVAGHE